MIMVNQVDHEHKAHGGLRFHLLQETAEAWPSLGFYQRFEQAVALVLTFLISGLIVVATAQLILAEVQDYVLNPFTPVSFTGFQSIFGMIMTVLIALEFNHAIISILHRKDSIVQLRTVILIALLAMARKFIIIDFTGTEPLAVFGLASALLALGLVYWLVRDQDHREAAHETNSTTTN
jgi:uncharacterized membrane protein (DUF373 family)